MCSRCESRTTMSANVPPNPENADTASDKSTLERKSSNWWVIVCRSGGLVVLRLARLSRIHGALDEVGDQRGAAAAGAVDAGALLRDRADLGHDRLCQCAVACLARHGVLSS